MSSALLPACARPLAPAIGDEPVGWRERLPALRHAWLKVIGALDYAAYVEHLRRAHPLAQPPSEREYVRAFFDRRDRGKTCCC